MRNAAAIGSAAHAGMLFMRANIHAPKPSSNHPAPSNPTRPPGFRCHGQRPGEFGIAVMIALACLTPLSAPLSAKDPPPDLAKRVAHRESETAAERRQYAYTQSVRLQEMDTRGVQTGEYRETREVIFSPDGTRIEQFAGEPVSRLKNLILTPEDFADVRNIQPFVMTENQLFIYETQ